MISPWWPLVFWLFVYPFLFLFYFHLRFKTLWERMAWNACGRGGADNKKKDGTPGCRFFFFFHRSLLSILFWFVGCGGRKRKSVQWDLLFFRREIDSVWWWNENLVWWSTYDMLAVFPPCIPFTPRWQVDLHLYVSVCSTKSGLANQHSLIQGRKKSSGKTAEAGSNSEGYDH